ncbi:MAG: type II toxin-antitoxin system Phd/YefM family antitoxin [Chloroflexi bacterium]|nr:type II toxin-antitoxin system Phd/YefM family antitoxin [Chloroflexota bacterium]
MRPIKRLNYSKAREQLRTIIADVNRTGRPVVILRRGKPEAVMISYEEFEKRFNRNAKPWRLAGSLHSVGGVDIDQAIREVRQSMRKGFDARLRRTIRDVAKS